MREGREELANPTAIVHLTLSQTYSHVSLYAWNLYISTSLSVSLSQLHPPTHPASCHPTEIGARVAVSNSPSTIVAHATSGWRRRKSPFIAKSVAFAASEVASPSAIVRNAACASPSMSTTRTVVSRTSTRTIARCVGRTCSRLGSLHRTCRAVMLFMHTASGS